MVSQASEDYLKAIYKLQKGEETVTTREVAERLGVSSASVTKMLQRLEKKDLVEYTSYQGVKVTEKGRKVALKTIRRHRLLELYLKEHLGYSWSEVHEEAEQLEHHISLRFEKKIAEILGYPDYDPHGAPIPDEEGELPHREALLLTEIEPPQKVVICRVPDTDPELLNYLEEIGVVPTAEVEFLELAPFGGPLTLDIDGETQLMGRELARKILVSSIK